MGRNRWGLPRPSSRLGANPRLHLSPVPGERWRHRSRLAAVAVRRYRLRECRRRRRRRFTATVSGNGDDLRRRQRLTADGDGLRRRRRLTATAYGDGGRRRRTATAHGSRLTAHGDGGATERYLHCRVDVQSGRQSVRLGGPLCALTLTLSEVGHLAQDPAKEQCFALCWLRVRW
jgi:hypothetical protein